MGMHGITSKRLVKQTPSQICHFLAKFYYIKLTFI